MDVNDLKRAIISYSKKIGIDKIGFTTAEPFTELKARLIKQKELGYNSGFEEPDLDKRTNPALIFEKPQSIISIALAYPSKINNPPKGKRGERRGIFCRASWGTDYHKILNEKLTMLESFIKSQVRTARCKSMVDTGELADRAVAERAGIGWSGKNCAIITPEFGSYVYLGEMITNIPFPPDSKLENMCGNCRRCLDACPTGALVDAGQINAQRCLSYQSQTKSLIKEEFRIKLGNRLYGCDSCQTACPQNRKKDFHLHPEMEPDGELVKPLLIPILSLSNRQFRERFGHMAGAWRGKNPIQRNAIIALGNLKDKSAIKPLQKIVLTDQRPYIRATAVWSLSKIGGEQVMQFLTDQLKNEQDDLVIAQLRTALTEFKQ